MKTPIARVTVSLLAALVTGCATTHDTFSSVTTPIIAYVEAPRLCQGVVRTYSDFASIEPGDESVIGYCNEPDGVPRNAPAIWVRSPDAGAWQPSPPKLRSITVEQPFRKGRTELRDKPAELEKALVLLKANPDNRVRLVAHHSATESAAVATKRVAAVRRWLVDHGIADSAIASGTFGQRGELVELQLSVLEKG